MKIAKILLLAIPFVAAACNGSNYFSYDSGNNSSTGYCNCGGEVPADIRYAPTKLKTNLVSDLIVVDKDSLSFSWQMNDPDLDEKQTAYDIRVSDSIYHLNNSLCIYDTGWIESDNNTAVTIGSLSHFLQDGHLYYWSVATKDKSGSFSGFSLPKAFVTSQELPTIKGIWASHNGSKSDNDFCFLSTRFEIDSFDQCEKIIMNMTAASPEMSRQFIYQAYINNNYVGLGPTRTGKTTDGKDILYYNSYDISNYVNNSYNSLGIFAYALEDKNVYISIDCYYTDGRKINLLNTNDHCNQFKSLEADHIFRKSNSLGTGYYVAHANNIDATVFPFDFSNSNIDYSFWDTAYGCSDLTANYVISPYYGENINRYLTTTASTNKKNGCVFVDLGKEIIGGLLLNINSNSIKEIEIRYGEQLDDDNRVKYQMLTHNVYVENWKLKSGHQIINNYSLMAYRYVEIIGLNENDTINEIKGISYHIPYNYNESYFHSNNDFLNELYELSRYTSEVTTQDLFVDSFSRERAPYEGDAYINQVLNYSVQSSYSPARLTLEWLLNRPTWPAEYFLLCSKMALLDYMYTGDSSFLKKNYDVIKSKNFDQLYDEDRHLVVSGETRETHLYSYLIDWPESERDNYDTSVYYNTIFNCLHVKTYEELSIISEVVGYTEEAKIFQRKAHEMKNTILSLFYNDSIGAFVDGLYSNLTTSNHYSQHATAYALFCDIYNSTEMMNKMANYLDDDIKMSVYGAFFLLDGLYHNNYQDIAFDMMINQSANEGDRTWANIINSAGATISPEAWDQTHKDNMTFSHPWSSAPIHSIVNGIFGINPTSPGFSTFDIVIRPSSLLNAKLVTPTIKGNVSVEFNFPNKYIKVSVPANTKARLFIPAIYSNFIVIDGETVEYNKEDTFNYICIGSGERNISLIF